VSECFVFLKHRLRWLARRPQGLLLPLLFVALMALSQQLFAPQFSQPHAVPIALIDQDQSVASALLRERLAASELLDIRNPPEETNPDQARESLLRQELSAVFLIEPGLEASLLAGEKRGLLTAYYNDDSIAAKLLSETVSAEALRLLVTEHGLNFLAEIYAAHGRPFTSESHRQNIEYYWLQGLTFQPDLLWTSGSTAAASITPLGQIVPPALRCFLAALCLAVSLSALAAERRRGILSSISARGRSVFAYLLAAILPQLAAFSLLLALSGASDLLPLSLIALWAALAVALAAASGPSQGQILLAAPLVLLALTGLSAVAGAIQAGSFALLNPLACGQTPSLQGLAALICHNGVLLLLLFRTSRRTS